ncbi:MAG: exo-alpha-sialidase, partial [Planctomycetes bacterium]|nr:exo-alpha-sialidase [Planctomycetota bacterium]
MTVGKDDVIHMIWTGRKDFGIAYTRSLDRGKTWAPQRNLLEPKINAEGPTIMADADGNVIAAWLDGRLGEAKESPVSYTLVVRQSSDNGKSFAPPSPVSESVEDRACMCCELSSIVLADGTFGIAHRKAFENVRDMTLWQWKPGGDWKRNDVSEDGWKFAGCPMAGAGLSVLPGGDGLAVAWMSKGVVYVSSRDAQGSFGKRKLVSKPDGHARHVGLAVAGDGRGLVTWYDEQAVHWNLLDVERVSIRHGRFPHTGLSKAKPVAVGGRFYIFY